MQSSIRVAVLVLSSAALAFSQRGAGAGLGGGQGVSGAGHGGHTGAGRSNGAYPGIQQVNPGLRPSGPNIGGRPYPIRQDIAPPTGLIPPAAAYTGISPGGLQTVGPRSRYPVVPVLSTPFYYPGSFGYDTWSSTVQPYNDPNGELANNSNALATQEALVQQVRQLTSDLEAARASSQSSTMQPPPIAAPVPNSSPAAAAKPDPNPEPDSPPVQIVLRSGEHITSRSFAVMSGYIWTFSGGRTRKLPISTIDLDASRKATEAAGGDFPQIPQ